MRIFMGKPEGIKIHGRDRGVWDESYIVYINL
jgi:hypothetical protein